MVNILSQPVAQTFAFYNREVQTYGKAELEPFNETPALGLNIDQLWVVLASFIISSIPSQYRLFRSCPSHDIILFLNVSIFII